MFIDQHIITHTDTRFIIFLSYSFYHSDSTVYAESPYAIKLCEILFYFKRLCLLILYTSYTFIYASVDKTGLKVCKLGFLFLTGFNTVFGFLF